jgi:hypothetical protein
MIADFFGLFNLARSDHMWRMISCLTIFSAALVLAADPSWSNKNVLAWSEEDAVQVLTRSPWVAAATVTILPARSEAQSRDGGRMGGGKGAGLEALEPSILMGFGKASKGFASTIEKRKTLTVRWESALPIRSAEQKAGEDAPTWEGDYYAIAVYGVAGLEDRRTLPVELTKGAFLRRSGKKDLKPARVEVIPTDEKLATLVYLFPRSEQITKLDRQIWFTAQIGQLFLEQAFDAGEMQLHGKLEL